MKLFQNKNFEYVYMYQNISKKTAFVELNFPYGSRWLNQTQGLFISLYHFPFLLHF